MYTLISRICTKYLAKIFNVTYGNLHKNMVIPDIEVSRIITYLIEPNTFTLIGSREINP